MKLKRKSPARIKALVASAKHLSSNTRYGLDRVPKGHWMRLDAAKGVRKERSRIKFGGGFKHGLKSVSYVG